MVHGILRQPRDIRGERTDAQEAQLNRWMAAQPRPVSPAALAAFLMTILDDRQKEILRKETTGVRIIVE